MYSLGLDLSFLVLFSTACLAVAGVFPKAKHNLLSEAFKPLLLSPIANRLILESRWVDIKYRTNFPEENAAIRR